MVRLGGSEGAPDGKGPSFCLRPPDEWGCPSLRLGTLRKVWPFPASGLGPGEPSLHK